MKFTQLAALCALASTAAFTQASPIVWQDFSLTARYGASCAVPFAGERVHATTATLECAAGLKAGAVFFSVDQRWDENKDDATYFELAPRLSLISVTGQKLAFGP